jgi:hypothetical protein
MTDPRLLLRHDPVIPRSVAEMSAPPKVDASWLWQSQRRAGDHAKNAQV